MIDNNNPALTAFVGEVENEFVFGQVLIRRISAEFELRHVDDAACEAAGLRLIKETELRALAQFTPTGAFRPLKSAPNLNSRWRATLRNESALWFALNQLYPGAVADWFATKSPKPPITSYRDFTARQTGMYRITTMLDDATVGAATRACCHKTFCLKRRLWTVGGLPQDAPTEKSAIPCLEPCAILLEFARKIARLDQEEKTHPTPSEDERAKRRASAEDGLQNPDPKVAECNFEASNNSRRLQFVLEKYQTPDKPDAVKSYK